MQDRPRLLVVNPTTPNLTEALRATGRFLVAQPSGMGGDSPLAAVVQAKPDVVLLDVAGEGRAAAETVEQLAREAPYATLILLSEPLSAEALTTYMAAGADGSFTTGLPVPVLADAICALHDRVQARKLYWTRRKLELVNPRRPRLIAVFSPKGGVGKTTLATNLAVALRMATQDQVVLLDLDVEAGDAAVLLDLEPRRSLADYARACGAGDPPELAPYLTPHHLGIHLLAAAPTPDQAEMVRPLHVKTALEAAKSAGDFVVIDTSPSFTDHVLTMLDAADTILLVVTPDAAAVKHVATALGVMADLQYPPEKIQVVINRSTSDMGFTPHQVEQVLEHLVLAQLPDDPVVVTAAINTGQPFVYHRPDTPVARAVQQLAHRLAAEAQAAAESRPPAPRSWWRRLFRRP